MQIRLHSQDNIRIVGNFNGSNFINVSGEEQEIAMGVEVFPRDQYIEIRKKCGAMKMFLFKKKGDKKHFHFDWWEDAEVVYSLNEVNK